MNASSTIVRIGVNTFIQFWGKAISIACSIASVFLLTRYLGVEGYGNFALVFAYLTFFAAIPDFGLQATIVNKLSKEEFSSEKIFGTYLTLKIVVVAFTIFTAIAVLIFMPYSSFVKNAIVFSSLGVAIGALTGFGNTFFQYGIRLGHITLVDLVGRVSSLSLILVFIQLKLGFFYILSSVLISNLLVVFVMFLLLRGVVKFSLNFDRKLAIKVIRSSSLIGIASFLSVAYFKLDTIMLSVFRNSSEVGIYSLSYKVFETIAILWTFYMASFFPFLSRFYHNKDWTAYRSLIKNTIFIALVFSVIAVVIGFITAPLAIRVFGGVSFNDAVLPLRILMLASAFIFINAILYNVLFVKNKTKLIVISLLISLLFNFLINLVIIPRFGFVGASVTTVFTEIFLFSLYSFLYFRYRKT